MPILTLIKLYLLRKITQKIPIIQRQITRIPTSIYYLIRNIILISREKPSSRYRDSPPRIRALLRTYRSHLTN